MSRDCSKSSARKQKNCRSSSRSFPRPALSRKGEASPEPADQEISEDLRQRLEGEVGDLFFVLVNIARYLSLDPESALKKTNRKFKRRFQWMEEQLRSSGRTAAASLHGRARIVVATGETTGAGRPVSADSIVIRKCHSLDEMRACVALQKEVWNFTDAELVPLRMFVVAEKVGGQVIGAFDGNELVGFALAVPGVRAGHSYLHSHMLAVRKQYRNAGLGRRIKLFQRDDALARGFELDRVDFRSAGNQERVLQHRKAGCHRAPL